MNFACGVVLYNNNLEDLKKVIKSYNSIFRIIYIYDNSENESENLKKKTYVNNLKQNIFYYSFNKNNGLSKAYNFLCKISIKNNIDYICLLDQDTVFSKDDIQSSIELISAKKYLSYNNVGIYVPRVFYNHKNTSQKEKKQAQNFIFQPVNWAISSGSFINLSIYKKTTGFDENYFIDKVDYDYCIEIKKLGYEIVQMNQIKIYQELGEKIKLLGILKFSEHNPLRHYYIFRNRLYFHKKNKNFRYRKLKIILQSIKHVMLIIFIEKNKLQKIKMIIKGWKDFKSNLFGKIGENL